MYLIQSIIFENIHKNLNDKNMIEDPKAKEKNL